MCTQSRPTNHCQSCVLNYRPSYKKKSLSVKVSGNCVCKRPYFKDAFLFQWPWLNKKLCLHFLAGGNLMWTLLGKPALHKLCWLGKSTPKRFLAGNFIKISSSSWVCGADIIFPRLLIINYLSLIRCQSLVSSNYESILKIFPLSPPAWQYNFRLTQRQRFHASSIDLQSKR